MGTLCLPSSPLQHNTCAGLITHTHKHSLWPWQSVRGPSVTVTWHAVVLRVKWLYLVLIQQPEGQLIGCLIKHLKHNVVLLLPPTGQALRLSIHLHNRRVAPPGPHCITGFGRGHVCSPGNPSFRTS